jgi:hypothetical protein
VEILPMDWGGIILQIEKAGIGAGHAADVAVGSSTVAAAITLRGSYTPNNGHERSLTARLFRQQRQPHRIGRRSGWTNFDQRGSRRIFAFSCSFPDT